jgi:hypothetical protein
LQVVVGPGHQAHQQVALAVRGVHLAHLVNRGEPLDDLRTPTLGNLQHGERGEPVAKATDCPTCRPVA